MGWIDSLFLLAVVGVTLLEVWRDRAGPQLGWARLVRLSYVVNVMHSEWFLFWLWSWGLGSTPLPPYFVMAAAWSIFVVIVSFAGAAVLYASLLFPVERC